MRPKVAITGNCQAQALTSIALALELPLDMRMLPPVFDVAGFSSDATRSEIAEADFVFHQLVSEGYVIDFIRPSRVASFARGECYSWPNIYFDGYFPGIGYMYAAQGGKVTGPLSDYHFSQVFDFWREGISPEEAWNRIVIEGAKSSLWPVEESFAKLVARERSCGLVISDYLATRFRHQKLFYSMNHPSNDVLVEMLRRMTAVIGVGFPGLGEVRERLASFPYTLDKIDVPSFSFVHDRYYLSWPRPESILGVEVVERDGLLVEGDAPRIYRGGDLVSAFYDVYERSRDLGVIHSSSSD